MQIAIVCVLALVTTISGQTFKDAVMLKSDNDCKSLFGSLKLVGVVPGNPCGATTAGCPYPDKICTGEKKESAVCTDVPDACKKKLSPKMAKDAKSGNNSAPPPAPKGDATTAAPAGGAMTTGAMAKATTAATGGAPATSAPTAGAAATSAPTGGAPATSAPTAKANDDKPKNGKEVTKDVTNTGGKVTMDVAKSGVGVVSDIANGGANLGRKKRNIGRKL